MFNWEKEFADVSIEEAVRKCVKVYGIEGTEQKAKELLKEMPVFRDRYLAVLHKLYNFGGNK